MLIQRQREREVPLEERRRQADGEPVAGELSLGNILVATGQITRHQLEDGLCRQMATGQRLGEELIKAGHASKSQVEGGLLLQRNPIAYALFVAVGLSPLVTMSPLAVAAERNAAMQITATVIANARVRTDYQATQLVISEADVARGYVEIAAASRISVTTNSRSGYLMEFHPVGNLFESVEVEGIGNAVQLGADGGSIVRRGPLPPKLTHELSFRFTLRPDTPPGNHPWPLLLSVRPL